MPLKTTPWNAADFLIDDDARTAYLEAAFEDGDAAVIAAALGDVAKAMGMARIAKEAKVSRESLYRSLSNKGKPELGTIVKVARSLGYRLSLEPLVTKPRRVARTTARAS